MSWGWACRWRREPEEGRLKAVSLSSQLSIPGLGGHVGWLEFWVKFGDYLWFSDDLFSIALDGGVWQARGLLLEEDCLGLWRL